MGCGITDPGACLEAIPNKVREAVSSAADTVIGNAVEAFAESIGNAANSFMKWLNGLWIGIDSDASGPSMERIQGELNWLVGYVAVASLIFAAIRMALDRKGQTMQQAFQGMWRVILVSAMATGVMMGLAKAADAYAVYIYEKPGKSEAGNKVVGAAILALLPGNAGLVIVFGLLAILAAFVQAILMILRIGVLVMLIGTLPLAAAASMTGWGGGWWKKHVGWLVAWLLFKPAAALVFYSGQVMMIEGGKGDDMDITQVVAGLGTLILATFALPALLKLVAPATAALGDTSGGGVAMGTANTIASGAVSLAGGGGGGGGGMSSGHMGGGGSKEGPKGSPSSGAGASPGGGSPAGNAAGGGSAGGGGAAGGAAAGAATGGAAAGVQAAAIAAQAATGAATEVVNSFGDNDGNKGHNE